MTDSDPLAELRKRLASKAPEGVTGTGMQQNLPQPITSAAPETVFQRLRYFENLVEHLLAHQKVLVAQVSRTGTAPAVMPHYPPLKSAAGDFDPNTQ